MTDKKEIKKTGIHTMKGVDKTYTSVYVNGRHVGGPGCDFGSVIDCWQVPTKELHRALDVVPRAKFRKMKRRVEALQAENERLKSTADVSYENEFDNSLSMETAPKTRTIRAWLCDYRIEDGRRWATTRFSELSDSWIVNGEFVHETDLGGWAECLS